MLRASDGLLLVSVFEPHLFGIAEMIQPTQGHILRAERESLILRADADEAAARFREQGVWEDVAALLSYHTAYLIYRDARGCAAAHLFRDSQLSAGDDITAR